jgi:competence CoiA-like predicted nuclease
MYKALDIRDNTEIVILDPKWLRVINQLREIDRQNFLVCQGCKQPVRVRAGEQRREHFAHKHLENCEYADESDVLRNARAVLYEWLVSKFGEKVTIEKKVDGIELFRPIDCWVAQDSTVFAYWIFDSTLKPEKRWDLQAGLEKLGVHINWVFALEILHTAPGHFDKIVLSTTERKFIQRSKYDLPTDGYDSNGSLHYLDAKNRRMTTFRSLSLYHEPQIYKGIRQTSDLKKILVSPQNGEFVHNGEHEKLQKYRQRIESGKKYLDHKMESRVIQERPELIIQPLEHGDERKNLGEQNKKTGYPIIEDSPSFIPLESKTGACVFCGEITEDWWWYDGKTGHCKCRTCLGQGRS